MPVPDTGSLAATEPIERPELPRAILCAELAVVKGLPPAAPAEIGGPIGPEPTRYGDWEKHGRCIDF